MEVPNWFWGEAVRHATYLINRLATRTLVLQTPYECFKGRKPDISHLRVFGCVGYVKINKPHLRKLDDRSQTLVHLAVEPGSKAYRLLDPTIRRITVSRDVVFDEDQSWKWSESEKVINTEPEVIDFGFKAIEGTEPEEDTSNDSKDVIGESIEEREDSPMIPRRSSRTTKLPSYLEDYELLCEVDDDYELLCEVECEHLLLLVNEEP